MGIINTVNCCQTQVPHQHKNSSSRVKTVKKNKDPLSKKQDYQKTLQDILNTALSKFQQKNKILSLIINGLIGNGSQAYVFQVDMLYQKDGQKLIKKLAMKRVNKHKLDKEKAKSALLLQKQIMTVRSSLFITSIQFACQDEDYFYFFMDLAQGGDGFGLISQQEKQYLETGKAYRSASKAHHFKKLGQQGVIFVLAGVILGLQSLHKLNVIYRDLKPENILFFEDGYPKLADFGVSIKKQRKQLIYQLKGTVLYFAPEVIKKKGYDHGIDLWALGVLTYELLFQQAPFSFSTVKSKTFQKYCQQKWKRQKWPSRESSPQMRDFIKKLICIQPKSRLGYSSFQDIKRHPIFKDFDWIKYEKKQLQSPLIDLLKKHPLQLKKQKQQEEYITLDQQSIKMEFSYVRYSQYETRSSLLKRNTTFVIEDGMQMKFIQNQETPLESER